MPPTVSINLCCYNSEKFLEETLQSIFAQTYKDWELVIINDGSTDSTESIIKAYINRGYPIIYHYQENHGLGYSRNKALELSLGEFVAFIDHDDLWLPQKIEKQIQRFDNNDALGLTFTNAIYFSAENKRNKFLLYKNNVPPSGRIFGELLKKYFLCLSTVIIRRQAMGNIEEWFEETFKVAEEADVFLRIAYKWECAYVDYPLTMFRMHANSSTYCMPSKFSEESELILKKLITLYPEMQQNFVDELNIFKGNIQYLYAMEDLRKNKAVSARKRLLPFLFTSKRIFLIYILSFLSPGIFDYLITKLRSYKA